ncbi:hypothetical protein MPSEU_000153400 [Mayamaea pseudoterrestris]|nr:hypothetical protein MPSEU_000153400 [Mayamaea pseudoterrestris]
MNRSRSSAANEQQRRSNLHNDDCLEFFASDDDDEKKDESLSYSSTSSNMSLHRSSQETMASTADGSNNSSSPDNCQARRETATLPSSSSISTSSPSTSSKGQVELKEQMFKAREQSFSVSSQAEDGSAASQSATNSASLTIRRGLNEPLESSITDEQLQLASRGNSNQQSEDDSQHSRSSLIQGRHVRFSQDSSKLEDCSQESHSSSMSKNGSESTSRGSRRDGCSQSPATHSSQVFPASRRTSSSQSTNASMTSSASSLQLANTQKNVPCPAFMGNAVYGAARTPSARAKLKEIQQEQERMHRKQDEQESSLADETLASIKARTDAAAAASSTLPISRAGRPPRPPGLAKALATSSVTQTSPSTSATSRKRKIRLFPTEQLPPRVHQMPSTHYFRSMRAAQRAGSFELLRDDVSDMIDTIVSCSASLTDITVSLTTRRKLHALKQMTAAATDLALLVSNQQNRACLHRDIRIIDQLLQSVLPALAETLVDQQQGLCQADENKSDYGDAVGIASPGSINAEGDESSTDTNLFKEIAELYKYTCCLLHFLTLDCTLSQFSVSGDGAGRIRDLFMNNSAVLQAVAQIVSIDPLLRRLRGRTRSALSSTALCSHDCSMHIGGSQDSNGSGQYSPTASASPSPSVTSSQASDDPTVSGRMRIRERKRQRLEGSKRDDLDDDLSFKSDSPARSVSELIVPTHESKNVDTIMMRVERSLSVVRTSPDAFGNMRDMSHDGKVCKLYEEAAAGDAFHSRLPLLALTRVVLGKMDGAEETQTCIDYDNAATVGSNEDDDNNPLLRTNRLIREGGIIPLLATALVDALVALLDHLNRGLGACRGCCFWLQHHIHIFVSLLDGACLLDELNRQTLCREGFSQEFGGGLVVALSQSLATLLDNEVLLDSCLFGDVSHDLLSLLTSLSHDNEVAAKELDERSKSDRNRHGPGTRILARILHHAASTMPKSIDIITCAENDQQRRERGKIDRLRYDVAIFCLNTLANLVEGKASRLLIAESTVVRENDSNNEAFVSWLTRWLVQQTESFQDAVTESTFGSSPSKHSQRNLTAREQEKLMIAGNGFVLVVCLMLEESNTSKSVTDRLRGLVVLELPGECLSGKVAFIKNTLKAFCNLYYLKIGDLAVAVVAPVKALIERLEAIEWEDTNIVGNRT